MPVSTADSPLPGGSETYRRTWPFLKTPLPIFLIVMLPINGLMVFLILTATPLWMKLSSLLVMLVSLVTLACGYVRRLVLSSEGASLRRLFDRIDIPWSDVKSCGVYSAGGPGGARYFYITRRDVQPGGAWDIDRDTIQVQDRPGLREAVATAQKKDKPETSDDAR